ncbi:MAG: hypothetical protein ISR65_06350 [Bacteriovoracaceae bacterium]|nr:hypothetical protein [Bacteriovoracaceae bacterium]
MTKSFLPARIYVLSLILIVILLYIGLFKAAICVFLFIALMHLLFRKSDVFPYISNDDVVTAPVNGYVVSVRSSIGHDFFGDDLHEITIFIPFWKVFGIYFPTNAEVYDFIKDEKASKAYKLMVKLRPTHGKSIGVQLSKNWFMPVPRIWVLHGDRGQMGAGWGYLPFGGTVKVYLDNNYKVLISNGKQVVATKTQIAQVPTPTGGANE